MSKENETPAALKPMVDLADLDPAVIMSTSIPLNLKHPITKQETGQIIWLFGKDSQIVTDYVNNEVNGRIRKEAALRARGKDVEPPTIEKNIAQSIELMIVATDRWENIFFNKEPNASFTVAKAKELYKLSWVREQMVELMGELENFTPA